MVRAKAYLMTVGVGLGCGFSPGFLIAAAFTGGTITGPVALAALVSGVFVALLLMRPWGAFGERAE